MYEIETVKQSVSDDGDDDAVGGNVETGLGVLERPNDHSRHGALQLLELRQRDDNRLAVQGKWSLASLCGRRNRRQ